MTVNSLDDYKAAVDAERAAWLALRGHLPGSPDFDSTLWQQWQAAVQLADGARSQMLSRTASMKSSAGANRASPSGN